MKKTFPILGLLAAMMLAFACTNEPFDYNPYRADELAKIEPYLTLAEEDDPGIYEVVLPNHLSRQGLFARQVENSKARLGRVLFYDKKLSKDGTVACANCHRQELAFSDDKALSPGVFGRVGERNSIALGSVANFSAYYGTNLNGSSAIRFFWDNRAETAMAQSRGSMTNSLEMDMHMSEIVDVVKKQPYYEVLFNRTTFPGTFPSNVTEDNVLEALANFIDAMGSYSSKFDVAAAQLYSDYSAYGMEPIKNAPSLSGFTASENTGHRIYQQKCGSCHSPVMGRPVFNYANNGLDAETGADLGVGGISGATFEMGTFKVPTLRNVELSGPFMHDGRFKSLEEVVEHYSTGVKNHPNLHPNLPVGGFKFTAQEKQDLVAFLHTMTDNDLVNEKRFSNPFK